MVEIFEGRLGGGKSYNAVMRLVSHLALGGTVATNITLNWDPVSAYIKRHHGVVVEPAQYQLLDSEQLANFHQHTPSGTGDLPVLVVIDEGHLFWNARDFQKTDKAQRPMLEFLSQSRKAHTDIIFITQDHRNIDAQFTRQIQYLWRFRDMQKWRIPIIGIGWPLPQICAYQYDYSGSYIKTDWHWKSQEIFDLYTTTELLKEFSRSGTAEKKDLKTVKGSRGKLMIKYVLIGAVILSALAYLRSCGGESEVTEKVEPKSLSSQAPPPRYVKPVSRHVISSEPVVPSAESELLLVLREVALPPSPALQTRGHYAVVSEPLRSNFPDHLGRPSIVTALGTYTVGVPCRFGHVVRIDRSSGRVKVRTFDGDWLLVETYSEADWLRRVRWSASVLGRLSGDPMTPAKSGDNWDPSRPANEGQPIDAKSIMKQAINGKGP